MTYSVDPRVDAYIDALPVWQQEICREVRELVHAADPEVIETIKRTNRPYFVLEGNICALPGQGHGDGRPNALLRPRHERHLPGQFHGKYPFLSGTLARLRG